MIRTFNGPPDNPLAGKAVLAPSLVAVRLELLRHANVIGSATGFVDRSATGSVLVTNRHVVTGRHQETDVPLDQKSAQVPDALRIWYRAQGTLAAVPRDEPLFDQELWPRWFEHPTLRSRADIAALPLRNLDGVQTFHLSSEMNGPPEGIRLWPTDVVAVVGYPFSKHAAGFPVWTTGSLASEPAFPYDGLPVFLLDARTREGQSGSPVFFHSNAGNFNTDTGSYLSHGMTTVFLGIYSGRIHREADIGMVWSEAAVRETINGAWLSDARDPDWLREVTSRTARP